MNGLREFAGKANVWHASLAPDQVGVRRVRHAAADGLFQTVLDAVETFLGPLTSQEGLVVGIVVGRDQVGGFGIGAGQHDGGGAHDVGGETC